LEGHGTTHVIVPKILAGTTGGGRGQSQCPGNPNKEFAPVHPSTAKSRSGWIIFYVGCPIFWASKLQSQVALSTTKVKYIAMSQSLRDVILIMNLLQDMREHDFKVICTKPYLLLVNTQYIEYLHNKTQLEL
jgi:hypothetical protein